jgi:CDP-diacylglycerol--serine O-phosphatidyltransferase
MEKLKKSRHRMAIPCAITLLNALCGFGAIVCALNGSLIAASIWVISAALCDFLDGFCARLLSATSGFGSELDSLADTISFCLAPAVVLYEALNGTLSWISPIVLGLYICAGICRLARFNSTSNTGYGFTGLPTTLAALAITQIVLCHPDIHGYATLGGVTLLALLMISRIPFPKITFSRGLKRRTAITSISGIALIAFTTKQALPTITAGVICWAAYVLILELLKSEKKNRWLLHRCGF